MSHPIRKHAQNWLELAFPSSPELNRYRLAILLAVLRPRGLCRVWVYDSWLDTY
ncbi:hypothetical protein PISMIDRAFT_678164 [Pisolithus microcarpus 441]|uniref:Uncharacterized protein n=1 Tax=Pisolithus microcarpus 441 TaxID=765257 RepID=A0A0C9ZQI3_9AGAM|nr:hypothetical protein PISMIDRAFT_678164 [Pisolithus microcarpus 441]